MENSKVIEVINDFFRDKIEKSIVSECKKILSEAKKGELKTEIENISKQEDAIEYNQWVKGKLHRLACLLSEAAESATDAQAGVAHTVMCFEDDMSQIELKNVLTKEISKIKELLHKAIKEDGLKSACSDILEERLEKDNESKTRKILASLAKSYSDIAEKVQTTKQQALEKYEINQWLDDKAKKAGGVVLDVTHISKLTHSSAKGSNINVNIFESTSDKPILVTTNCASKLPMDFAYSTAEYAPVAEFLQLDCDGELLGKLICEDPSILKPFSKDEAQLKQWQEQFSLAFNEKRKSTHEFLKQVYFPVDSNYHLLTPLVSSSMAQIIYDRIWLTRQENMIARKARNKDLFSNQIDVLFYKTAVLKITQTNHQNVSNLNGKRTGQLTLLPAVPPQWEKQIKPPTKTKTIFNRELGYQAKEPLEKLRKLLLAIKFNELSVNLHRKQLIAKLIAETTDVVFDCIAQIHGLKHDAGWSLESRLPTHQQYWLDPFRIDEDFQTSRADVDWQTDISNDFAKWVNKQLKDPKLTLGVAQERHWRKLFIPLLREFNAITNSTLNETTSIEGEKA
jgi:CRISPR-associated protein Csy1